MGQLATHRGRVSHMNRYRLTWIYTGSDEEVTSRLSTLWYRTDRGHEANTCHSDLNYLYRLKDSQEYTRQIIEISEEEPTTQGALI